MSDIGDIYSISNSIDIRELKQQQQAQMRLTEFRERADALAQQTGTAPLGFFAFEKTSPTPREHSTFAKWGLGLLAGITAAAFSLSIPVVIGVAAIGFLVGTVIPESETARTGRALERYDGYLSQAEMSAASQARSRIPMQEQEGPALRTNHAQTVLEQRQQQETAISPGL